MNGLSNNTVTSITQDAYGYIWVGTNKGLNRFDGSTFQQFYSDSSTNSLPVDFVFKLRWLDKEQLAVITLSGLHVINTRTLEERNIIIPPDSLVSTLSANRVIDALGDKNGNIFIATGAGFYHFNNKNQLVFRYDHFSRKYVEEKKPLAFAINIIRLEENILLISGFKGPFLYYADKKDFHALGNNDPPFYQKIGEAGKQLMIPHSDETSFTSYVKDKKNISWFNISNKSNHIIKDSFKIVEKINNGVNTRLVRLNDTLFAINATEDGFYLGHFNIRDECYELYPQVYFRGFVCGAFFIDKNKQLWIGTNKGLLKEKKSAAVVEQIKLPTSTASEIQSLAVSNNKIFAGTNRQGILVFDCDSLKQIGEIDFTKHRKDHAIPNLVPDILSVHHDTLYAGIAGVWINSKNLLTGTIPLRSVDTSYDGLDMLFKDSRGNLYLKKADKNILYFRAAQDHDYTKIDYTSDLSKLGFDATGIAEDPEGNIWFSGAGMTRLNYKTKKFDLYLDSFPSIKIPRKAVSSNLIFYKSFIYFGIHSNGLIRYNQEDKTFSTLTRSEGLPDNTILALLLHNDNLWIATESGLARYDLVTKKISSFGMADGIPHFDGYIYKFYYDSIQHKLYGAFRNTVFRFNPDKLVKNDIPPVFNIESIIVAGNQPIFQPTGHIKLAYNHNTIVINLSAVNFEDASQQQFAYRLLKKGDEPWQTLGSQRSIIFSDLSPGNHRLQVKAFIRNQNWPDQIKEINLLIAPPFWKRAWFIGLLGLLLSCFAYYLHRRRINRITQRANLDKLLAQTEMKALLSQMNPHFIFNCLNSIKKMILDNENGEASRYLSKFAQLIRITLTQSTKSFISLQNTIDYLQRYLEMEQIRKKEFEYFFKTDESLNAEDIYIPPMLIQPFIENSIWHSERPEHETLLVSIRFFGKGDELICIVEDNGIGIEASLKKKEINHHSVGIANIRQRIQVLNEKYNLRCTLMIEDKSALTENAETGTIVTLSLPIKNSDA